TSWIEVNINNLAAVPSIVFGLLGLAVYINVMGMPRSAPVVGGLTLAMMILPVIIIATRVSIGAIPQAIRDAALGLGASPVQVVCHHVLPLALPGIMTGTILGLARAIGETAPLIMIGMVAFIADVPSGFTSAAAVMPVQVYLWASSPEAGFAEKTAAGILVLLVLLLGLNALAIYLRKRFEVRW
ncbi:MAG: ABC transporter permease subunit, partial [Rickettsiales bacterium]|nr:ABC transporter permease subunit [Rickettsiales bacterium]